MSLSENFQEAVESFQRPLAIFTLAVAALGTTGCASGGRFNVPSQDNIVGHVTALNLNRKLLAPKRAAVDEIAGGLRLTQCPPTETNQTTEQDPSIIGGIVTAFTNAFTLTRPVGIGHNPCPQPTDQNGVGPRPTR